MTVEIINVGTELLLGEIVNTDAVYLQNLCRDFGFHVYYQTVVGDNPERFRGCLSSAFARGADCVITTGGLGPTTDDLTKEISAEFLGLEMVFNQSEAEKVGKKCRFLNQSDDVPENNYKQAYFPKNCFILENEVGTANGCVMEQDGRRIVNLPGPPKELTYVVEHSLKPYLERFKADIIFTRDYVTMGVGESKAAEILADVIDRQTEVTVALYASEQTVRVRLGCKAPNRDAADEKMKTTGEEIEKRLGEYIIREKDLQKALQEILPPYKVEYLSAFRFRDGFLSESAENADLLVTVGTTPHPVGELLSVEFQTKNKSCAFKIPLLKKAELSHSRLEARITGRLYAFLKERQNC